MTHLIERHLVWFSQVKAAAPASLRARRRVLRHAGIRLPWGLNDADEAEIAHYLSEWNGWSRTTYYGHLRGYYRWAVRAGHLTVDPMAGIPYPGGGPRVPHPCSDAELAIALTAPQWPWRRAILLAAYNGLRCAELCRAALEDITDGWLTVHGKGGRVRVVPLAQPVIEDLVQHGPTKRLGPGKRTPLVADPDGLPISPHVLSDRQRRLWSKLGIGHMTLHSLRHWHATSMLTAGVDLRTVQELLGHASVATTQVYTEVTDQRRAAAVAALPVLNHTEPDDSRLGVANAA